jgi:hypothetical protein
MMGGSASAARSARLALATSSASAATARLGAGDELHLPFVDRVKPLIDLREQVVAFKGQPVITEDNLVVLIAAMRRSGRVRTVV